MARPLCIHLHLCFPSEEFNNVVERLSRRFGQRETMADIRTNLHPQNVQASYPVVLT
jgi:hypothetical protein